MTGNLKIAALRRSLAFIASLMLCFPGFTQHHRFRHLSVDDGLIHNAVFCITQDEKGFMWFCTENGLNRYDGSSFKLFQYDPQNKNSLSANDVVCIAACKNYLWVGTQKNGLNRIDLTTHEVYRYPVDPEGNGKINSYHIQTLEISPDKKIWAGTYDKGINIIDPQTGKISYLGNDSLHQDIIAYNWIKSLAFDQSGNVWMSHPHYGISRYGLKSKKWMLFTDTTTSIGKLNNTNVRRIHVDKKNRVWISTWTAGLNIYDVNTGKMYSTGSPAYRRNMDRYKAGKNYDADSLKNLLGENKYLKVNRAGMVFNITEDDHGNIWLAAVEEGVFCFNPETGYLRNFRNNPSDASSICDNNILSVYKDKSGLIWIGSLTSGISIYNPYTDRFGYYKADPSDPKGMPDSHIWSIVQGKRTGKYLLATTGHIMEFDSKRNEFSEYVVDNKNQPILYPQSLCQAVYEDHMGKLWISINGGGVHVYDPDDRTITKYTKDPKHGGLLHNTITAIAEDDEGNMWLGMSYLGLNKYLRKENRFTALTHKVRNGELTGTTINYLLTDHRDQLWIATDSGLNVLNIKTNELKVFYAGQNSLNANDIYALYLDQDQSILIGTGEGICRYDPKSETFSNLTKKYNLLKTPISGITRDFDGNLWLQPSKGILFVKTKTGESHLYDYADGLQSSEFLSNTTKTFANGEIIFGGSKGFNYFFPGDIIRNTTPPGVVITQFLLQNKPLKFDKDISSVTDVLLDYDHYFFTVEFACLDYTNPAKNKYKYKLEGFTNEWVETGNNHQVTFVNLAPGNYTLHIKAANNDGVWSEEEAILHITITPPFWQTTWFYILCGITIVLVIYGYIRYREQKLKKEKAVLEEKVDQRTVELREEKEKVEEAHKEIRDSMNYAKQLQEAILPPQKMIDRFLPQNFILYKPKDIVAGDFYWAEHVGDFFFIASADCTGHGVPGAMVSVVCSNALNRTVKEFGITDPGKILDKTTDLVLETFEKSDRDVKDGMDISLLCFDHKSNKITWSGANNPLWYISNGEMIEIKANKQPIGKSDNRLPFTTHEIRIKKGEAIYLFTDGYADQFGGEKGKKYKYKPFMNLLSQISGFEMNLQKTKLDEELESWKSDLEQNDDICIIGIRI